MFALNLTFYNKINKNIYFTEKIFILLNLVRECVYKCTHLYVWNIYISKIGSVKARLEGNNA